MEAGICFPEHGKVGGAGGRAELECPVGTSERACNVLEMPKSPASSSPSLPSLSVSLYLHLCLYLSVVNVRQAYCPGLRIPSREEARLCRLSWPRSPVLPDISYCLPAHSTPVVLTSCGLLSTFGPLLLPGPLSRKPRGSRLHLLPSLFLHVSVSGGPP